MWIYQKVSVNTSQGFSRGIMVKNLPVNAGDAAHLDLISGLERSPGVGNGNQLQ